MFAKDRNLPALPGIAGLFCVAFLIVAGAVAQAASPALTQEAAVTPCVIQPVMTEAEIDACRQSEKKSAAGVSDVGPKAAADDAPLAKVAAPRPLTCEIKPVMTDAEIDACRRR